MTPARRRLLAVAAVLLVGCTTAKDCTVVGCSAGVTVRPPPGVTAVSTGVLTVCVDDACVDTRFEVDGPDAVADLVREDLDDGDDVTATLVLPDGSRFEVEGSAREHRPNGPGCGPTCTEVSLTLAST